MHMLDMVRGVDEEPLAVTESAAQHANLIDRAEGGGEQAVGVEALEPLAVAPIGFGSSGGTFGLTRVDQHDLEATGLQELEEGNPVDACRCHSDGGHAA